MEPTTVAMVSVVIAAASEIIALSPLRSNSVLQIAMQMLKKAFPKQKKKNRK